jgi:predicted MPP superfamily phosphohydrolase
MISLVIGDIHTKHEKVEKIISQYDPNCLVIFTGDYFDDFYDSPESNAETAKWLKESLTKPNRIHLMGNHDFHYRIQPRGITYCSGFDYKKYEAINEVLTQEDWDKIKFFYAIDDFWFSHAGITKLWFEHPVKGLTVETIQEVIDDAVIGMKGKDVSKIRPLWAADTIRGGRFKRGGLLWNDWYNSEFHDGITQIMGHTPHDEIQVKRSLGSALINVDTHLNQYLLLDTKKYHWSIKDA